MTTHSIILSWKIPRTEEAGSPWGCKELGMTGSDFTITHVQEVLGQGEEIEREKGIILLPSSSLYL